MANIISVISQSAPPGPKREHQGRREFFIVKLDGDPTIDGCECPVNTIGIYNSLLFFKETDTLLGWRSVNDLSDRGIILEGDTSIPTPVNTIIRDNIDGELYASIDGDMAAYTKLTGPTSIPAGVITVAKSGGDFLTIGNALSAASPGDVVVVYPGAYAESITIPAGIRVIGYPNSLNVKITGADTTSTRVTMGANTTIRSVTIVAPSSGSNPALDSSGLLNGELTVAREVVFEAAGGSGPLYNGPGAGLSVVKGCRHNGGTVNGTAFLFDGGGQVYVTETLFGIGTSTNSVEIADAKVEMFQTTWATGQYTSTSGIFVSNSNAKLQASGINSPDLETSLVTNAFRIGADGVKISILGSHLHSSTYDLLIDSALTGAGSTISFSFVNLEKAKRSIPSGFESNCDLFLIGTTDEGSGGDNPGFKFEGNIEVGNVTNPSSISVGTGDSSTLNMVAYSYDDSLTSYTNITAPLSVNTGSTATWNTDINDGIYIGYPSKFKMIDYENIAELIKGANDLAVEIWTGATWESISYVVSNTDGSDQYAKSIFERANGNENVRFNSVGTIFSNWAQNDPPSTGTNRYWMRLRNTGTITQSPAIDRIKIGVDFFELKETTGARFGETIKKVPIFVFTGETWSAPSGGVNAPSDVDISISANVTYREARSLFADGSNNRSAGTQFQIPQGVDTSRTITFRFTVYTDGVDTNNIEVDLYVTLLDQNQSAGTEVLYSADFTPTGTAGVDGRITYDVEVLIEDALPGDTIGFSYNPQRSTDTNTDDLIFLNGEVDGWIWTL